MKRVAIICMAVTVAGIGAWLLTREPSSPISPAETPADSGEGRPGTPTSDLGSPTRVKKVEPKGTGRIVGKVMSGDKPVVANLKLTLPQADRNGDLEDIEDVLRAPSPDVDAPLQATASSDAEGRFEFVDVPLGTWSVDATATDGRVGTAWGDVTAKGVVVHVIVVVERKANIHALHGRAIYADGQRWEGFVLVGDRPAVRTDSEGRFTVEGLVAGDVSISVLDPGRLRVVTPSAVIPSPLETVIVVDERFQFLTGRVVAAEDGRPIAGAEVATQAWLPADGHLYARTLTAEDGTFSIAVEAADGGQISASASGRCRVQRLVEAGETDVRLALPPVAHVQGTVVRSDKSPIPGATVQLSRSAYLAGPGGLFVAGGSVVCNERGSFEADVPPAEIRAWVFGPDWVSDGLAQAIDTGQLPTIADAVARADGTTTVELVAVAAPWMEGRVVDAGGALVAGAILRAELSDVAHKYRHLIRRFSPPQVVSAADGSFRISPLISGRSYELEVVSGGVADGHMHGLRALASGALVVEVKLPTARAMRIVVKDEGTGAPVAGAEVTCSWNPNANETPFLGWGLANDLGIAWLEGLPGPGNGCSIAVNAAGYAAGAVEAAADATEAVVSLEQAKSATIEGRIELESDGALGPLAVAGVLVGGDRRYVVTDGAGRWRIPGLTIDEDVTIRAERTWRGAIYSGDVEAKAGAANVVLKLKRQERDARAGKLLVRVLDDAGRPVPWASVKWSKDSYPQAVSNGVAFVRDMRGAYVGSGDNEKSITLAVFDARGDDGQPLALGSVEGIVVADDARDVEVRLPAARSIEGKIVADDGRGVGGAKLRAARSFDEYRAPAIATAISDANGVFRLAGLASDDYVLLVDPPDAFATPKAFRAKGGATDVVVRLRAAVTARISVVDAQGAPLPGTRVHLSRIRDRAEPPRPHSEQDPHGYDPATTDRMGVAILGGLDPEERYHLRVAHPKAIDASEPAFGRPLDSAKAALALPVFVFQGWKPADVTVRLVAADVVRGKAVDGKGRAVDGAEIYARAGGSDWVANWSRDDGSFGFPLLPPGSVTVRVGAGTERVVVPGQGPIVLTIDTGPEISVRIDDGAANNRPSFLIRSSASPADGDENRRVYRKIGEDGRVRFTGLDANARYAFWVSPMDDGRSVLARDLKPGADEIVLHPVEGKKVSGAVVRSPDVSDVSVKIVEADLGEAVAAEVDESGKFESDPLPPGRWVVRAEGSRAGKRIDVETPAIPGQSVELKFADAK